MVENTKHLVKMRLKDKVLDIPIVYSNNLYEIYNKKLSETNDYKEAFFSVVYAMILKECNQDNIIMEDIKNIEVETLDIIVEIIINSSIVVKKLHKNEEFYNCDCFKKFYLLNNQLKKYIKIKELKNSYQLKSISENSLRPIAGINIPANIKYSPFETLTNTSLQWLNMQQSIGEVITPRMIETVGLSQKIAQIIPSINTGYGVGVGAKINLNNFSDLGLGITYQVRKQLEPFINSFHLESLNIKKNIPKYTLGIEGISQFLKYQNIEFNRIVLNLNSAKETLLNTNIGVIRSVLLKEEIGKMFLDSQLKWVKESLNLATKFNFGDKLIEFDSLNRSIINAMKPFITDFNSVIISRNNIRENIKNKAIAMNKFNWWYISSLPIEFIDEIYDNKDSLNENEVNEIICQYYRENDFEGLESIIEKWTGLKYFNRKLDILKEAIDVHKIGKYRLTVPTLVPMIEGIIRGFMADKYGIFNESFNPIYRTFKGKVEEIENTIAKHVIVCIDNLYCRFSPANPNEVSDFSRHKISHGLSNKYGSEVNSLKVILFLDEIFEIICSIEDLDLVHVS